MNAGPAGIERGFLEMQNRDGSTTVSYRTAGAGWITRIVLVLPAWLIVSILFGMAGGTDNAALLFPVAIGLTLPAVYLLFLGKGGKFKITPEGFVVDGKLYDFRDISEVFLDNPAGGTRLISSGPVNLVAAGGGAAGTMATGAALSSADLARADFALRSAAYKRSSAGRFRVGFKHGAENIYLVRNAESGIARAIFDYLTGGG